jgi:transcriptional regulator with XRE-family HTH domain
MKQCTLKAFFEESGLSQRAVAQEAQIDYALMRQYVSGVKEPSAQRLESIESAIHRIAQKLSQIELVTIYYDIGFEKAMMILARSKPIKKKKR